MWGADRRVAIFIDEFAYRDLGDLGPKPEVYFVYVITWVPFIHIVGAYYY